MKDQADPAAVNYRDFGGSKSLPQPRLLPAGRSRLPPPRAARRARQVAVENNQPPDTAGPEGDRAPRPPPEPVGVGARRSLSFRPPFALRTHTWIIFY